MGDEINPLTPLESKAPNLSHPKSSAAGIPAVISTMKYGIKNMGIINSIGKLSKVNDFQGFDCPGCAWPDPDSHRSFAEFCENGAKAVSDEATKRRANRDFWSKWSVSELSQKSDFWLNSQGRLTEPMILYPKSNHYQPISWDDAFDIIADNLVSLDNPDEAIFYTSGRTSNEAAFLWQLLARRFGTNNLPDCSNMCHESSGVALTESIGIGKGTVTLDDFNSADLIIVVGQNPGTNHPRMLTALRDAKKKGASIISINPLTETGMKKFKHPQNPIEMLGFGSTIADKHLKVNINSDQALFRAFSKSVIESGSIDEDFIDNYTNGYDEYKKIVLESDFSNISKITGISLEDLLEVGEKVSKSKSTIVCWAMGITQHKNSVSTIQEIVNFLLLGGHIGKEGAGVCPVRGHSNVQGDRTVGINHKPSPSFIDNLEKSTGIRSPERHGFDSVEAVKAMENGSGKVFLAMGGNFLSAMSDTNRTSSALKNCNLTAHVSTKPNRSHLITGKIGLILPCLGRTEEDTSDAVGKQFVTVENSMGIVHSSTGTFKPASDLLISEPAIVSGIGGALESRLERSGVPWKNLSENYNLIRDLIENTIPGFEDYNTRIKSESGFYLPNPPRDSRTFKTKNGLANFISNDLSFAKSSDFMMMTIRSHDQYNTTIYGLDDRYRGIKNGRRVVLMNENDMSNHGFSKDSLVDLSSEMKSGLIVSPKWFVVPYDIPEGNVATYFPESNMLIPLDSVADGSNTPTSKSVPIKISKSKSG
ncbi:MAG: FdhF/YdeP family oxidoreductase [Candidatus Thalassarchaeaceae archaeon]|nr:FdhF/YdeP family oxidoreductase [Candidatus Thalassarchaeaceae archaeon]|tara:strand:- start:1758 stop:4043 length:2286 start_codon:yes stop_codon:yes gene_type:complete